MSRDINLTRNRSVSVDEFQDNLKYLGKLIPREELEKINEVYKELKGKGQAKARLLRPIVPIEEWINSPYYVGRETHNIFPFWKEQIINIFNRPEDKKINQVIITGSIGIGKTTFAAMLLLRRIYELSCYENIHNLFNLMGVSRIAFAYLSVTKDQAENSGFSLLKEWIDDIPYFQENFPRRGGLDSMVIWPQENMIITFGSVANHFIGMNVIGSVLDEANFFEGRQVDDANMKMNTKVSALYSQMINRSQSRFVVNGVNHSLSLLVSSTTVESSFTEEMIAKAQDDPHTYVISPALWEVKPDNYKGEKFLVFTGGSGLDPFVIKDIRDINLVLEMMKYPPIIGEEDPLYIYKDLPGDVRAVIIEVPEEHRQAFQGDIIIALQDLAGFSVSASGKFFNNQEAYSKAIDSNLEHPFSHKNIVLSTTDSSMQDGFLPIKAYMKPGFEFKNKQLPRFMHLDLAQVSDSVGISMAHISGWKNIYGLDESGIRDNDNYLESEVKIPIITVDFMLEIKPPNRPHRIAFSKIRDFIVYLNREKGIKIDMISADQYQSAQLLQELGELGFETKTMSVDRNTKPYDTLANLFYEDRIRIYDYDKFRAELFNLIRYPAKNKIDHPNKGSKDVADSVAGSIYNAILALDKTDVGANELYELYINSNIQEPTQEDIEERARNKAMDVLGLGNFKVIN